MSIVLKQFDKSIVMPEDDAKLFNFMLGENMAGIVEGVQVTYLGANKLRISAGWGICQGRMFVVEEETISAKVSAKGELNGRLIINIDTSAENPTSFVTQAEKTLPGLIEEDLNRSGTVYQLSLATYKVNEVIVSNIKDSRIIIKNKMEFVENNSWSLSGGIAIDKETDLNNITNIGNYYSDSNSNSQSLKNSPTKDAFTMKVIDGIGKSGITYKYIIQIVINHRTTEEWRRYATKSQSGNWTFDNWIKVVNAAEFNPIRTLAQNAIPKTGGEFFGKAWATASVRELSYNGELINCSVRDKSGNSVRTQFLVFERE